MPPTGDVLSEDRSRNDDTARSTPKNSASSLALHVPSLLAKSWHCFCSSSPVKTATSWGRSSLNVTSKVASKTGVIARSAISKAIWPYAKLQENISTRLYHAIKNSLMVKHRVITDASGATKSFSEDGEHDAGRTDYNLSVIDLVGSTVLPAAQMTVNLGILYAASAASEALGWGALPLPSVAPLGARWGGLTEHLSTKRMMSDALNLFTWSKTPFT